MIRILKLGAILAVTLGCCSLCSTIGDTHLPFLAEGSPTPTPTDSGSLALPTFPPQDYSLNSGQSATTYLVTHHVYLHNDGPGAASHISFTVALVADFLPYQGVNSMEITPGDYTNETDQYGNHYAKFDFYDLAAGDQIEIQLAYEVTVYSQAYALDFCQGQMSNEYTSAEQYIESDSYEILSLAQQLSQDKNNPCEQARSFYDYIGDEFTDWVYHSDDMGALYAARNLSGDCTEYSDLFIALNRAADIPAQFLEGVVCCTENGYDPSQNKHDWTQVYLPGTGWVPVDPTFGRQPNNRDKYFASLPADHIIVTQGRNLNKLMGYHYYAYQFWWNEDSTNISNEEEWSILEK